MNTFRGKIRALKESSHLLPVVIILCLGLLPLLYIHAGLSFFGADTGNYMFHPLTVQSWDTFSSGTGIYNPPTVPLAIPFQIFYLSLNSIGISFGISQAFLNSFLFMSAGFSMYLLVVSLFGGANKFRFVAIVAAIFYMFNAFNMMIWSPWVGGIYFLVAYALFPLMFAFFIRGLNSKNLLKGSILFGLSSLLFVSGNVNIPFSIIILFSLMLYLIFHLFFIAKDKTEKFFALKFALVAISIYLLLNLWWIAPTIINLGTINQLISVMDPRSWLANFSSFSSVLNVIRLYGYPGWENYFLQHPSFYYVPTIMWDWPFILISFLPPIVFGFTLLLKKYWIKQIDGVKIILFFFLFYLLSIFLSKGTQEPFGNVFYWLYSSVPGLTIFRSGFVKFGIMIALSSAILFGIGLSAIYEYIKNLKLSKISELRTRYLGKITILVLIALILTLNYSFFTGDVVQPFYHETPSYYFSAANYLNSPPGNFNVLNLYGGEGSWVVYNWDKGNVYIGTDVDPQLINNPVIHPGDSLLSGYITEELATNTTVQIDNLLNLMNIKYILLHNDIDTDFYNFTSPQVFQNSLSTQNVSLEQTFGKIGIYMNNEWQNTPVYVASQVISVNDSSSIANETANIKSEQSVFCLSNQLTAEQFKFIASVQNNLGAPQDIKYKEISATQYTVQVTNASKPFLLVLSNSYNGFWVANVNGQQEADSNHFMVNGYANAWYINKTGTFTVVLEFWPQNLFYVSAAISITSLIVLCVSYRFRDRIKTLFKKTR
jgi:hypothetical protein